jgi:hypothetical protein
MKRRNNREIGWVAGQTLLVLLLTAGGARADQVTSKGTVLHGKITAVSSGGITFEPEYGKGSIKIKWEDIEDLQTDGNFQILYGEDEESDTPLQGFSDGKLLAGQTREGAVAVDIATILIGFPIGPEGPSWEDWLRSNWRYWDGNFDVAYNLQRANIDTQGLLIGFKTVRKKDPVRLIFGASYRYATERKTQPVDVNGAIVQQDTTTTIQDQWYGLIRGEYDLLPRLYLFSSGDATYDAIQHLSIRAVPRAGVGYVFFDQQLDEDRRNFLSGEVGPGWVYERYFGGDHRDYFTIGFGAVLGYHLPYGAHLDALATYLPAVDDWANDYLLHGELGLTMPLIGPISGKLAVLDDYDSTPAANTQPNSLFITFGLSLGW